MLKKIVVLVVLLLGSATFNQRILASTIPTGSSCTDASSCLSSAMGQLANQIGIGLWVNTNPIGYDLLDFRAGTSYGCLNNLSACGFTYHNASEQYTPYSPPKGVSWILYGNGGGWDMPSPQRGVSAKQTFTPDMNVGFTIMVQAWIDGDDDQSVTRAYVSLVALAGSSNPEQVTLARHGIYWGIQTTYSNGSLAFNQFPWEAAGALNSFQEVFYTFTPDGRVRIDVFAGNVWNAGLLDTDALYNPVTQGTPTSNPSAPPLGVASGVNIYLGGGNGYISGDQPGSAWVSLATFNGPLSPGEVAAYYQASYSGSFTWNTTPCDTGYMLNAAPPGGGTPVPVPSQPCNYMSNWSLKSPSDFQGPPD